MRKRNDIRPNRELIKRRVIDVVGGVKPDYGGEECPGAECAAAEPGYVRGLLDGRIDGSWVVDAGGVG